MGQSKSKEETVKEKAREWQRPLRGGGLRFEVGVPPSFFRLGLGAFVGLPCTK